MWSFRTGPQVLSFWENAYAQLWDIDDDGDDNVLINMLQSLATSNNFI